MKRITAVLIIIAAIVLCGCAADNGLEYVKDKLNEHISGEGRTVYTVFYPDSSQKYIMEKTEGNINIYTASDDGTEPAELSGEQKGEITAAERQYAELALRLLEGHVKSWHISDKAEGTAAQVELSGAEGKVYICRADIDIKSAAQEKLLQGATECELYWWYAKDMHSGDEQADIPEEFVFSVTLRITGGNPADVLQIEFRGENKPYFGGNE